VNGHFRFRALWLTLGWALIGLVIYLSLTPAPPKLIHFTYADKVKHLMAYGALMGWFGQLYAANRQQLVWALGFGVMGVVLEFLQGWSGYRTFDVVDMLADAVGVLLGWWLTRGWFAGVLSRVDRALA